MLNNSTWAARMLRQEGVRVYAEDMLEDRALRLLKILVDFTGAKIIVSSSWRKIPSALNNLTIQLNHFGMYVFDTTPYVGRSRGDDITAWFNRNPGTYRYVILDDDSDMPEHMDHLVQTRFDTGLTREHVDKSIQILMDGELQKQYNKEVHIHGYYDCWEGS